MSNRNFLRALLVSTVLCVGFAAPAVAQLSPPAPVRQSIDSNGVDLFLGTLNVDAPAISMGQGDQGLSYYKFNRGPGWVDNVVATVNLSGSTITVSLGPVSDRFTVSGSSYIPTEANGATLTFASNIYTYVRSDGTIVRFDKTKITTPPFYANAGRVLDVTRPSGEKLTYSYSSLYYCSNWKAGGVGYVCISHSYAYRVASVTNSYGYSVNLSYNPIDAFDPNDPSDPPDWTTWGTVVGASMTNLASTAGGSGLSEAFGYDTVGSITSYNVTDSLGRTTKYRTSSGAIVGVTKPGSTSEDITIAYVGGRVSSITTAAGTIAYGVPSDVSGVRTVTVTDPLSHTTTYTFDIASQRMTSATDALGHTTSWQYDSSGRPTRVTAPEGNYVQTTYDARGNVTQTDMVAKSGSGVSTITTLASYDATCANAATCNQPNTTTDAKGNVTDYTYDATHGGVTSVKAPAPSTGAIRPETRYGYASLQAYYNIGGSVVASGQPVYRLTGISTCQTTASCAGTADEVKTTISYGPQAAGTGNNLLPVSISKGAGNGSLTATTTIGYDDVGNRVSVDGPLSGTADTTTYRYDVARQLVGVISPDPDGGGALKRRAQRLTYNPHGIVTVKEIGTVNGTGDTDWAGFVSAQQLTTTFDAADRKVKDVLTASSVTYQVAQYSYDTAGRLECSALRMNSATWGSLPSSACTLATTGSAGPDRITRTTYDAVNRPTLVQTAYGTADQASEVATTYTDNGQAATVTDAQNNRTTYEYDGVDRLVKTRYPSPTAGAGTSSTTDYEQLLYDANGNVTSRRLRGYATDNTQHIDYSYDKLNRVTLTDLPSPEADISYSYDLLGGPLTVSQATITQTFAYDALGRTLSEAQPFGSMSYQYDLAGNRTVQLWNDGFYVTYDHLVTGEVSAIRENGATSGVGVLATYSYDDLGWRTGIARGNGTTTSYGLDNASRLTSLVQNPAGTAYDLTLGFGYNPASQIAGTTRSNDVYAWGGSANVDRTYAINGLNQMTVVGGGSLGYDARGNLTSTGSNSYTYNAQNLLTSATGGTSLYYDALARLAEYDTSVSTRFLYDGSHMAAEIANPSGAVTRRYVYGPGDDEPVVWYEGAGTSDRRWLHADERGSVVAVTDGSGATIGINSYDEYGVPASGNIGRFQYTGQAYLPELGLYYYKARIYSSRLGRFLQTDPIGYGDGMNWYSYVGGDPVNWTDPSGLKAAACPAGWRCDPITGQPIEILVMGPHTDHIGPGDRVGSASLPGNAPDDGGGSAQSDDTGKDIIVIGTRISQAGPVCERARLVCEGNAIRLYDRGYIPESFELRQQCFAREQSCIRTDNTVQNNPKVKGGFTVFPPNDPASRNGGGIVIHRPGLPPLYLPPTSDPLSRLPRR